MNSFSYDITIAYSNEKDMTRISIPLKEELERKGVNVQLFDVNTGSCLGAVCDSHFFVPIPRQFIRPISAVFSFQFPA